MQTRGTGQGGTAPGVVIACALLCALLPNGRVQAADVAAEVSFADEAVAPHGRLLPQFIDGWRSVLFAGTRPAGALRGVMASAGAWVPAGEMAANLDLQIERGRLHFRSSAVDWLRVKSAPVGRVADFLIGGGDSGWHLSVDPIVDDEVVLEWKFKFR